MRGRAIAMTLAMLAAAPMALDACGDKFLLVGRGLAFGRAYASVYPGSILIYGVPATRAQLQKLHEVVRKAGHRVTVSNAQTDLSARLTLQSTDIVIADVALKSDIDRELATLASKPSVLYLVTEGTTGRGAAPDAAAVVKSGEKTGRFLSVIEDIMKARQQAGVRIKKG